MLAAAVFVFIVSAFVVRNMYLPPAAAKAATSKIPAAAAAGSVSASGSGSVPAGVADTKASPAASSAPLPSDGPIVSINFDDGFESAYQLGLPILDKAGLKATWYIITGTSTALDTKGYMTTEQLLALQADGQEIGAHTRHHLSLGLITDPNELRYEILGSKEDLLAMGIKDVSTFAYPEGSFSPLAEEVVKESGFTGARITRPLLNNKTVDPYLLKYQRVQYDTTWADIQSAIDQAIAKKEWVILVFHRLDETGNEQSAPSALLQQTVDYIKQKNVPVVTNEDGLKILGNIK
jgi:peptidoglycan/xylan/chitin deacetylase (PgdA/CDA1 family)